eukprot:CAMPEP_0168313428 /NCGR_PEP_ID=MMETSP0210-20121227/1867_1 /TAXON_ID=40633 /ORGANISM="Condylostoma magnum, Strain COL2" /LENGTH=75 /DNA_ID=CAMNT_0008269847 /DNA_START=5540 /DNA_END=5767 /DNA_ORIENTATION=+
MDVKSPDTGKWLIGRTIINEDDWDFKNAVIDKENNEVVIATHRPTGYRCKILKSFKDAPILNPQTGLPISEKGVV